MLTTPAAIAWALSVLCSLLIGFLASYIKKKGEHYATKEDAAEILKQVTATTQATKEIEARISSEVWDRQKRWELKREVVFGCAKRISQVEKALVGLHALHQIEEKPEDLAWLQSRNDLIVAWKNASAEFDEAKLLVAIVCSRETKENVEGFSAMATQIAIQLTIENDAKAYVDGHKDITLKLLTARSALRTELGLTGEN